MAMLADVWNVVLICLGFGAVIFVHELGHFLAARWAGIRVHAFAIGFGPAVCSWRKGLGLRAGSSEKEYQRLTGGKDGGEIPGRAISPTEYRLNWLPLGGYVKMLGQEDANPGATSVAPDSFGRKPVWKRMIVISAGVVMNIILAAALFLVVFKVGLREGAPVVGQVGAGTPAEAAGLRPGDAVIAIDGHPAESFSDLQIAAAMSKRGVPIEMEVRNILDNSVRRVSVMARPGGEQRFMQIGVGPALGADLWELPRTEEEWARFRAELDALGLVGVEPGMTLTAIDGREIEPLTLADGGTLRSAERLMLALEGSEPRAVTATFRERDPKTGAGAGASVDVTLRSERVFERGMVMVAGAPVAVEHVMGLQPVVRVAEVTGERAREILRPGDLLAKVGTAAWPSIGEAIGVIRTSKGKELALTVQRDGSMVEVMAQVSGEGMIGFRPEAAWDLALVAGATELLVSAPGASGQSAEALETAISRTPGGPPLAGSTVVALNDYPVVSLAQLRDFAIALSGESAGVLKLRMALPGAEIERHTIELGLHREEREKMEAAGIDTSVKRTLTFEVPGEPQETIDLTLSEEERKALAGLGWRAPEGLRGVFQPANVLLKASNPAGAVVMGVRKTHRTMMLTYLTFARLFEGTVRVEHLKGPVGIAHIGSRFAAEGVIYLLYFLALISVNLAVINFLPLPIVDGGLFLMLCYEGLTRRPVPERIQAGLTVVGLLLIGTMFIVVTFNDIMGLF